MLNILDACGVDSGVKLLIEKEFMADAVGEPTTNGLRIS